MGIVDNVQNTAKLTTSGSGAFFTIITNPFFILAVGILFFPLDIVNYIVLLIVNFFIALANLLIFLVMIILWGLLNSVSVLINIPINIFNDFSITIPVIDVEIDFPNLPTIPTIGFPTFIVIPFRGVEDVRIFEANSILILMILEFFGISFPF